jgi:hypothetical protein
MKSSGLGGRLRVIDEAYMHRFMMFVDGSNLFGVAKHLGVQFDDYEKLYRLPVREVRGRLASLLL